MSTRSVAQTVSLTQQMFVYFNAIPVLTSIDNRIRYTVAKHGMVADNIRASLALELQSNPLLYNSIQLTTVNQLLKKNDDRDYLYQIVWHAELQIHRGKRDT